MSLLRSSSTIASALLLLPLLACGDDGANNSNGTAGITDSSMTSITTTGETTDGMDTTMSTTASTTASTTNGDGDGDGDGAPGDGDGDATTTGSSTSGGPPLPKFDLVPVPDSPMYDTSCGEIDFLFVIDNSGSMGDEQAALANSFPNFIDGIELALESVDSINVGVSTTDSYFHNIPGCTNLGGLVVQTGGPSSSNMNCGPYAEGFNFMTQDDDLDTKFNCAARVGVDGSADERPMQAMVQAVNGTYGGMGQCNEGFIREDALLVIIIITDEPDINSAGGSADWYNAVVTAKDGIPENVVVVSIINTPNGNCGSQAFTIADFTTMFGVNGFMSDICSGDFNTIFNSAIEVIDVACDNYVQN